MIINVMSKDYLITDSEVEWISNTKILLTINNEFYLINLQHSDWIKIEDKILYGKQHISMRLFVSILKCPHLSLTKPMPKYDARQKEMIKEVNLRNSVFSIQKMSISNLIRFVQINKAKLTQNEIFDMLFFLPCEELGGANMLQRLCTDYDTIKPFLEKIDSDFVMKMNH